MNLKVLHPNDATNVTAVRNLVSNGSAGKVPGPGGTIKDAQMKKVAELTKKMEEKLR